MSCAWGGYRLRVMRVEQGHTEGDLVLWSARERVLWAGGLVYGERVPELAQGSVDGWLARAGPPGRAAPARGDRPTWCRAPQCPETCRRPLTDTRAYLSALREGVLQAMDEGLQASDATVVDLPAYRTWAGHSERQGFNAQRAWRELEPVWMDRQCQLSRSSRHTRCANPWPKRGS